jgi:UDP-N-acetylmuramate dehydrogenase
MLTATYQFSNNTCMNNSVPQTLSAIVKTGTVESGKDLRSLTTMKIGGPAKYFVQTNSPEEIILLSKWCQRNKLSLFVIGGCSNLVFSDNGFLGVVLKLKPNGYQIVRRENEIDVRFSAGYSSHLASVKMAELGYSGFECLFGLPGTIGGGIYQNSKWPKRNYQFSDNLLSVTYIDNKYRLATKSKAELTFAAGYSSFQDQKTIILSAVFRFKKASPAMIKKENEKVMAYRRQTQPIGELSAGCIFKNPKLNNNNAQKPYSAGYLIDKAKLKGLKKNGIMVSKKHANFFINTGEARAKDYLELLNKVKQTVKKRFQIELYEEVNYVK